MRVILADDHTLVRDTLALYLERLAANVQVQQAASFEEAHGLVHQGEPPDLVILDLLMPGMQDFEGLVRLRGEYPEMPVVILSAVSDSAQARRGLDLGASGYIPKTIRGPALIAALQKVLSGQIFVPAELLDAAVEGSALASLTQREREVLTLLTAGHANKEIAKLLGIKEITVKVHLKSVFRKFGVTNRTQAVRRALELGVSGAP